MTEEIIENIDSEIDAVEVETTEEETTEDSPKESPDELSPREKQFLARAKKAEAKLKETKAPEVEVKANSDEPDYARLAFLNQQGVEHPDDIKVVQDEASRLKLPLTDVLGMEHIKSRLQTNKDGRTAQEGMPKGGKRGSASSQQDVDYWVQKGETPTDNPELAEKVIDARMKKETTSNKFSDELYTG